MCLPAMPTPGRWTCTTTIQNFRTLPFPRTLALPPLATTPLVGCPPASTVCAPQGSAGSSAHPGISASEQILGSCHLIGCNSLSHSKQIKSNGILYPGATLATCSPSPSPPSPSSSLPEPCLDPLLALEEPFLHFLFSSCLLL